MDDTLTPDPDEHRLSLPALLEEPLLASARIISRADTETGPVTWCLPWDEVMSRPDLLTGAAVYTRPETLPGPGPELASLVARGARVLIVDGSAPDDMVWPAGLTVLELGFPVGFTALNRLLAERTLTQEAHVMRYAHTVHQSFAGLLHRGAGLPILIREVAALTTQTALALDSRGRLLAHAGHSDAEIGVLLEAIVEALPPLDDTAPAGTHTVEVYRLRHPDGLFAPATAVAGAMRLAGRGEGWVVVVVPGTAPRGHDIARYRVVVEQAGMIIGTEMLRQRSVDEAEERARGDFVQALVHGNFANDHDLRTRAALHEIDLDLHYIVFVARGLVDRAVGRPGASMVRLARYAADVLPRPGIRSHITVIGDVLVVIRSLRAAGTPDVDAEIEEYAHAMALDLETRSGQRIPVAHGRPAAGARDIAESYREARVTLGIAQRLGLSGSVAYNDLRGFGVLAPVADAEESRRLVRDVLDPLRMPGAPAGAEALLSAYLEEGGNINAAARRLRMHRNTAIAKLDRISQLLGMQIREPENRFTLWLAVRLDLLAQVRNAVDHEIVPR